MSWFDCWPDLIAPLCSKSASTLRLSILAGEWCWQLIHWKRPGAAGFVQSCLGQLKRLPPIVYQNIVVKCMARAYFGLAQWTKTNGRVATSSAMRSINSNQNSNQNVAGISCFLSQFGRWTIVQSYTLRNHHAFASNISKGIARNQVPHFYWNSTKR